MVNNLLITVHHLENSISARIIWLLEELSAEYEIITYARDANLLAPSSYKALHPAGTAPIITDGNIVLAETNAIVDYILDKYPQTSLRPSIESPERIKYLYWFHSAQGSLAPMQLLQFIFGKIVEKSPFFVRPIFIVANKQIGILITRPRIERLLKLMNDDLEKNTWLTGEEFTAADLVIGQNIEMMSGSRDFSDYPYIQRFLMQIRNRTAYQKTVERVGGFGTQQK